MRNKKNITYSSRPSHAAKRAHRQAKNRFPTYDTSAITPKSSKKKLIVIVIVAFLALAILGFTLYSVMSCNSQLASGQTIEVVVDEGSSANDVANILASSRLIANANDFKIALNNHNADSSIKSGTYLLQSGKSCDEYVEILVEGPDSFSPKVVVYEGMRLSEIADAVDSATKGRISANAFKSATSNASKFVKNYSFLQEAGTNSLEGYLFPKTYSISSDDSTDDIIVKMLDTFSQETKDLDYSYPKSCGLNSYDVVILASIIEKESDSETQRKVASVFYNRLNDDLCLNSDATTAYEVGHDPSPEEIHSFSSYSTYTNRGLCPTPICNPSQSSLEAACKPDNTDYYYFYFKSDADGKTNYAFSKTYEEHQQNIESM